MRRLTLLTLLSLMASPAQAALTPEQAAENQPVQPLRIIGDVYYVGASDIANPIMDPAGCRPFVEQSKSEFEAALGLRGGAASP
jgi:hypothetical protein